MISTQRYFIHIDNKSIVPWTSEIEGNYKFKEITQGVAFAIERGRISAGEVVEQIMRQVQAKPATLEQMLEAKLRMNVREGELNLESQVKADNSQRDVGEARPFSVEVQGGGEKRSADAQKQSERTRKPPKKADVEPAAEAEKVAAALCGSAGQPAGVNV